MQKLNLVALAIVKWLLLLIFFTGSVSLFFNDNRFQILGFLLLIFLVLILDGSYVKFTIFLALSLIYFYYDSTMMGSKIILLIYAFQGVSGARSKIYLTDVARVLTKKIVTNSILLVLISLSFLQYAIGVGEPGIFNSIRVSAFFWDPNYFSLLLFFFFLIFSPSLWFIFCLVLMAQSSTIFIAAVAHILFRHLNFVIFAFLVFFIFYLPFLFIDGPPGTGSEWLDSRLYSMYLRASWAHLLFLGDALEDIAPHISLISGMKKNTEFTILFFVFFILFRKITWHTKSFLLVASFGVDVFFGPLCFLVPIVAAFSDSSNLFSLVKFLRHKFRFFLFKKRFPYIKWLMQ